MTREEAIEVFNELKKCYLGGIVDAIDMAIKALKAQEPRVLSEVELREIKNEIPVWIEIPFEGCDIGHWVLVSYHHYEYKGVKFSFDEGLLDGLGAKWRCWTSRPDQATREATPWERLN